MNRINFITKLLICAMLWVIIIGAAAEIFAGNGKNKNTSSKEASLWQRVDETRLRSRRANRANDENYKVFQVDQVRLREILAQAPLESAEKVFEENAMLEIPMPDGNIIRFRLEESPVLAPEVAAQFPKWKTYSGQGMEDPTMTARFDFNANGFHAYVMTAN